LAVAAPEELCARLHAQQGRSVCRPCRGSSRTRDSPAKKSLHAGERDTPRVRQARTAYCPRRAALDLQRLQLVDEGGVHVAMTRLYGRAPTGARVLSSVPRNEG
jgi:hypothetical protein